MKQGLISSIQVAIAKSVEFAEAALMPKPDDALRDIYSDIAEEGWWPWPSSPMP